MIGLFLSWFGYAKVPFAAVQLVIVLRFESAKTKPDMNKIYDGLTHLEKLLRSARTATL